MLRLGSAIWASSGLAAVLALLTQMNIARHLAPVDFGEIASLLTLFAIVGSIGHLGMGNLLIRRSAEEPARSDAWATAAIRMSLLLTATASVLVIAGAMFRESAHRYSTILLLPVAFSYTFSELAIARYQVLDRLNQIAPLQLAPNLLRLLFSAAAVLLVGTPLAVSTALGAASAVAAFVAWRRYRGSIAARPESNPQPVSASQLLRQTWPYGVSMATFLAYSQGGVLILRWLDSPASAGSFALVANILMAVYLLPIALFQRMAARQVAVWSADDPQRLLMYLKKAILLSSIGGVVAAAAMVASSTVVVRLLFGVGYQEAGTLLGIVALAIPFRFVSTATGTTLTSHAETKVKVAVQGAMLAMFLFLSWVAIQAGPWPAIHAVSGAFVACELMCCVIYSVLAWRGPTLRLRRRPLSP